MTWEQFFKLTDNYGPVVAATILFIVIAVIVVGAIVRLWPFISGLTSAINNLVGLDKNLKDIKNESAKKTALLTDMGVALAENTADTKRVRQDLDAHIKATDEATKRWADRDGWIDGLKELHHNGGSTMKDDSAKNRRDIIEIKEILQTMKPASRRASGR